MTIKVFIECEKDSNIKNVFDESTLEKKESFEVSRKYPFAYGFIQGTTSGDGDCLDCFILTKKSLKVGEIIEAKVVGLMEQYETRDGIKKNDHNILACLLDDDIEINQEIKHKLIDFICHVWDHREGKKVVAGRFLDSEAGSKLIKSKTRLTT